MSEIDKVRLNHLWNRRKQLDQTEWRELHGIIGRILGKGKDKDKDIPLRGLSCEEKLDTYINEFFGDVVYQRALKEEEPPHEREKVCTPAYIHTAFKNYLTDQVRKDKNFTADRLDDYDNLSSADDAAFNDGVNEDGIDLAADNAASEEGACLEHGAMGVLYENGLSQAQVRNSAKAWLGRQESWVLLYLGLHHCPDKKDQLKAKALSLRYAIQSYHYKMRQLGLSRKKNDLDVEWFRKTMLGQWIEQDLGIRIEADNNRLLHVILGLLCDVSLDAIKSLQNSPSTDV